MLANLTFWAGVALIFLGATLFFHLFPRTIASVAISALFLGRTDLGGEIGVFSLETGRGEMTYLFVLLVWMFFFLFIGGVMVDLSECKPRWHRFCFLVGNSGAR